MKTINRYLAPHNGSVVDRLVRNTQGVAGIEFALIAGMLSLVLMNVADIAIFEYQRMEVENAADLGAMTVLKTCDTSHVPATTLCSGLNTAITKAVQSTSLGNKVSLKGGAPTEGYYCVNSANILQYVSDVSTKPSTCAAAGMSSLSPGDYIKVQVVFTYVPMFGALSAASLLPTSISKTALLRIG